MMSRYSPKSLLKTQIMLITTVLELKRLRVDYQYKAEIWPKVEEHVYFTNEEAQKHIENPVEHLRGSFFVTVVIGF